MSKQNEDRAARRVAAVLIALSVFLLAVLMAGCGTVRTVTVTEYKERIVHDTVLRIDSILVADSVYQRERERTVGDTVFVEQSIEKYKTRWRTKDVVKIVEVQKVDSIPYEVEVVKEVAKPLNGWQRFIYGSGYAAWAILILALVTWVLYMIAKWRGLFL